jgi:hypothetical protein
MITRHSLARWLLVAAIGAGCKPVSEPGGTPVITGVIVARNDQTPFDGPLTVHVKETEDAECGIVFTLGRSTRVQRRASGGMLTLGSTTDLTIGRHVAVWTDVVAESCPGQAGAKAVEITD